MYLAPIESVCAATLDECSNSKNNSVLPIVSEDPSNARYRPMTGSALTDAKTKRFVATLQKHATAFDFESPSLGRTSQVKSFINTENAAPLHSRPYNISPSERSMIQKKVARDVG